jgi:CspA family cold shock protein
MDDVRVRADGEAIVPKVIEIAGVIKWFNIGKGFGFITPNDGTAEVLLHITCLLREGYQTAHKGSQIVCMAVHVSTGLQAFHVLSMDESTAVDSTNTAKQPSIPVVPTSGLEPAVVKMFDPLLGFGFVTCDEDVGDIFVHAGTFRRYGIIKPKPGRKVYVRYGMGPRGLVATEVRLRPDDPA